MKSFPLFLFIVVLIGGLFLPSVSLAGSYNADGQTVNYDGLVPCGKCVDPVSSINASQLSESSLSLTRSRCNETSEPFDKIYVHCQFCHVFVMVNGIVSWVLINLVPPIALLMIVVGGIMFYFGGGNPSYLARGKQILKSVAVGLLLVYGAYLIIGLFLGVLGVAEWTGLSNWAGTSPGPFSINCPIGLK